MATYFECKLRYDKMSETGMVKKVNEHYLVDALSFTEAEARIIKEMTLFISGNFEVSAIKKTKISEIISADQNEKWFLIKCAFITFDERTATEKKSISMILVGANTPEDAIEKFHEAMKSTMSDYEIVAALDTPYVDIFITKE